MANLDSSTIATLAAVASAVFGAYQTFATLRRSHVFWVSFSGAVVTLLLVTTLVIKAISDPAAYPVWVTAIASALTVLLAASVGLMGYHRWARPRSGAEERNATRASPLVLASRDATYDAVSDDIEHVNSVNPEIKELRLAATHGHDGDRRSDEETYGRQALSRFEDLVNACVTSKGRAMWRVYDLYNITTPRRLQQIIERIERHKAADGYEVKGFFEPRALPMLSPLIVDEFSVFLGHDDPMLIRVDSAIRLVDAKSRRLVQRCFDDLWDHPRALVIKSPVGIEWQNVERLRQMISAGQAEV